MTGPQITEDQRRRWANDRLTEDMQPSEVWPNAAARVVAEAQAAGVEVPSEARARE